MDGQALGAGPRALVVTFPMPPGTVFADHTHARHQLVWAAAGVVLTTVADKQWVLPSSRALWVPAGVAHTTSSTGEAVLRSVYVDPTRTSIRWDEPTPVEATPLLVQLVHRLGDDALPASARRRTEAVLFDVLVPVAVTTIGPPLPSDPRAREVARALLLDPADDRTLAQWGVEVGASARTLARAFSAQTQLGFGRWRTEVRLQAALRLLADGEPVGSVAYRVGYGSPSAFVAAFRAATGTTPGDYFGAR